VPSLAGGGVGGGEVSAWGLGRWEFRSLFWEELIRPYYFKDGHSPRVYGLGLKMLGVQGFGYRV